MERLIFPAKMLRAKVIKAHVQAAAYAGVVVFTCGNAAQALRAEGLDVLEIGPQGALLPGRWWTPAEIHRIWPERFDATSGHLPAPLMAQIAQVLGGYLGNLRAAAYEVPTGSGETIVCLRWAYPSTRFVPVYGIGQGTEYNVAAPLNYVVGLARLDGAN